jgi:hypothetical protein
MKRYATYLAVALMLCAMTLMTAAKDKKGFVKFYDDLAVNETIVKKGEYRMQFDEQAGELTIFKGNTAVAKTKARLEKRDKKASNTVLNTSQNGKGRALVSITLEGEAETIVLDNKAAAAH